jgi:hypothetical protein
MPEEPSRVTREQTETFLANFAEDHKPATTQTRYKCLRLFLNFLLAEGEITKHPDSARVPDLEHPRSARNTSLPPPRRAPAPPVEPGMSGRFRGAGFDMRSGCDDPAL